MAKVYEALKRAEEERKRRAAEPVSPVAPLDWAPMPEQRAEKRLPWWRRFLSRGQFLSRAAPDSVTELNKRRISLLQPESFVAEQFRSLRGRIDAIAAERPIRSIAVTSALPGEGKTTASVNLSIVTAMALGRQVLLVDCDLRKPKVHRALGLQPEFGLAEVLADDASLEQAVIKIEDLSLDVLAVRRQPPNPAELLSSPAMRTLLDEMVRRYDRVILDTPATLSLPDAKSVAQLVDGLVFVVRAGVTDQEDLAAALDVLDRRRLLGLVLNGHRVDESRYGYYTA